MFMTIQSNVKDKLLATSSETSKVENARAEMLRNLDQQMEKRVDDGKVNVVTDALSRKERVKPRRVRAMAMTIQYGMERKGDESLYFMDQIWVLLVGSVMVEAHASRLRWTIYPVLLADAAESVRDAIGFESPVLWAEIGESSLIGPELVPETIDKVVLIKEKLKAVRDRQKSYADNRRKPLEFKKCLADANLHVTLNEIKIDKTLHFVEELVEIMDCEIRNLKRSKIPHTKVHRNSKRGPEFTWEREDHMKSKYPQLFVDRAVESTS
ncbi:hypothetical protein Tco_1327257 [Tanacetum coccineum]